MNDFDRFYGDSIKKMCATVEAADALVEICFSNGPLVMVHPSPEVAVKQLCRQMLRKGIEMSPTVMSN